MKKKAKMPNGKTYPQNPLQIFQKPQRRIPIEGSDAYFASLELLENPAPQPWMSNPSLLPKKPPAKIDR